MARRLPATRESTPAGRVLDEPSATLLDAIDHLLTKGVVTAGDVTLGVAGVDLIYLRLSALLCAADRLLPERQRHRGKPRQARASSRRGRR
jgi:hypothetical protein